MGFDISIEMSLAIHPETGRPYYYNYDSSARIDGVPDIVVPEHLRRYLKGRGNIFHVYTQFFNEENRFNVGVREFLEHFPSWDDVQVVDDDYWTEKDHCLFKELIEWCAEQTVEFRIDWSY